MQASDKSIVRTINIVIEVRRYPWEYIMQRIHNAFIEIADMEPDDEEWDLFHNELPAVGVMFSLSTRDPHINFWGKGEEGFLKLRVVDKDSQIQQQETEQLSVLLSDISSERVAEYTSFRRIDQVIRNPSAITWLQDVLGLNKPALDLSLYQNWLEKWGYNISLRKLRKVISKSHTYYHFTYVTLPSPQGFDGEITLSIHSEEEPREYPGEYYIARSEQLKNGLLSLKFVGNNPLMGLITKSEELANDFSNYN